MEKIWTILDLINWCKPYFEKQGVDSPRLTVELMIAHVLHVPRIQLYSKFDRPFSDEELSTLRAMIKRRAAREPLQYILGETEFYGLPFAVSPAALIPRPETELLVEYVLKRLKQDSALNASILDIGTGTGCIAIALAKNLPEASVYALDVSEGALELAKTNAERNSVHNVQFGKINILETQPKRRFRVIVANPPYIGLDDMKELEPELSNHEPRTALTDEADGLRFYRRFAEIFPAMLEEGGSFAVEMGFGQASAVEAFFRETGFTTEVVNDYAGIARICAGWRG